MPLRHPSRGCPRFNFRVRVHGIDLLKIETSRLVVKEKDDDHGHEITSCEHIAIPELDRRSNEWSEEREKEIPSPVPHRRERCGIGTDVEWEHLTHSDPNTWSPCRCETTSDGGLKGAYPAMNMQADVINTAPTPRV